MKDADHRCRGIDACHLITQLTEVSSDGFSSTAPKVEDRASRRNEGAKDFQPTLLVQRSLLKTILHPRLSVSLIQFDHVCVFHPEDQHIREGASRPRLHSGLNSAECLVMRFSDSSCRLWFDRLSWTGDLHTGADTRNRPRSHNPLLIPDSPDKGSVPHSIQGCSREDRTREGCLPRVGEQCT